MKGRIYTLAAALVVALLTIYLIQSPPDVLTAEAPGEIVTAVADAESDASEEDSFILVDEDVDVLTGVTNATVVRVVDGDTFVANDDELGEVKIRLLGVDTPETVDPRKEVQCFGHEASDFTKETLTGKRVYLEEDPQADERDKYGRLLRIVYLSDGTDFNAELIARGYAYAYLSFPLDPDRKHEYKMLENEARHAGRGLWAPSRCTE